ncbi:type II toxin-antitoxin system RelE/ParE family toxin [bacterium]|nr:type II toxin-antitoxin system RelE/ParE family toxin [Candidatus Omnitrophota bacterium]MBU2528390.1 type II toxin-antitoxin system RelE/ParE family toxin [bacterium]MBU3930648.1 type II toxin-antitoxin system RelE/ParE family toxin [bacterium]MBU4122327.1 type II toxin-antitoxin system RelE/ParE family toxin [bacterium]
MREIVFYETSAGRNPIDEFLNTLSSKQAQKAAWVLKLVEDLDIVPSEYFRKMTNTDDLWEVRVKAGSNIFRFVGFFDGLNLLVLAHAFQKKTPKTPRQAIQLAEKRKRDYLGRKKK